MTPEAALSLDWPALAGDGSLVAVLVLTLVKRICRAFGTPGARERFLAARDEPAQPCGEIAERMIGPLEGIAARLEAVGEVQAAQARALERIVRRLERLEGPPAEAP